MSKVTDFKAIVRDKLLLAQSMFDLRGFNIDDIKIECNLRGKAAGRAEYRYVKGDLIYKLRFNREAIELHWNEMVEKTITHEIAHLVAWMNPSLGAKNHNKYWKRIDKMLGGDGSRTHSMGLTPARKVKKHIFNVDGMIVEMGAIRFKKLLNAETQYSVNHPTKGRKMVFYSHYVGEK